MAKVNRLSTYRMKHNNYVTLLYPVFPQPSFLGFGRTCKIGHVRRMRLIPSRELTTYMQSLFAGLDAIPRELRK